MNNQLHMQHHTVYSVVLSCSCPPQLTPMLQTWTATAKFGFRAELPRSFYGLLLWTHLYFQDQRYFSICLSGQLYGTPSLQYWSTTIQTQIRPFRAWQTHHTSDFLGSLNGIAKVGRWSHFKNLPFQNTLGFISSFFPPPRILYSVLDMVIIISEEFCMHRIAWATYSVQIHEYVCKL